MKRGELEHALSTTNRWWRRATAGTWEHADRDLRAAREAPFEYQPGPLHDIRPPGLYLLFGPRRVGKTVEIKRAIQAILAAGVDPRRVIHAACDGWRASDLKILVNVVNELSPPADGPRYFFLDEVAGIKTGGDWVEQMKWLRDNTELGDDCVVLSGSSAGRLATARSLFGGRGGRAGASERTLLPMTFRSFCRLCGPELPGDLPVVRPRDMLGREAAATVNELRAYIADLVPLWERYLQIGGYPRAVHDWLSEREVSEGFLKDLWDVIHGDALTTATATWTAQMSQKLLEVIAKGLCSPFNVADAARDLGDIHHDALDLRLHRMEEAYLLWSCYQNEGNRPKLNAQRKLYFLDPLVARLAHLRSEEGVVRPPDFTQLTEQQLGNVLLAAREREKPGSVTEIDSLLFFRTATGTEVDFTSTWLKIPYEGKYVSDSWLREAQTARAAFGKGVIATMNLTERSDQMYAVPVSILAYLLSPG